MASIVPLLLPGIRHIVIHGLVGGLEAFGLDGVGLALSVLPFPPGPALFSLGLGLPVIADKRNSLIQIEYRSG